MLGEVKEGYYYVSIRIQHGTLDGVAQWIAPACEQKGGLIGSQLWACEGQPIDVCWLFLSSLPL